MAVQQQVTDLSQAPAVTTGWVEVDHAVDMSAPRGLADPAHVTHRLTDAYATSPRAHRTS